MQSMTLQTTILTSMILGIVSIHDSLAEFKNGSFEEWQESRPVGWTCSNTNMFAMISRDTQTFCDGKASLLFNHPTQYYTEITQTDKIPADPNKVYQITFRYKKEGPMGFAAFMNYWTDAGKEKNNPIYCENIPADTWIEKIAKFVPEPDVKFMALKMYASGTGKAWLDKVTFQELGPKTPKPYSANELAHNGGFEDYREEDKFGGTPPVGCWVQQFPMKVTIIRDPAKVHSGKQCFYGEPETEGAVGFYQPNLPVDFQKKYKLSLWAKGDGTLNLCVYQYHGGSLNLAEKLELTKEWKEYSVIYYPSSSLVDYIAFPIFFVGEAWIDDVSVKEVKE